MACVFATDNSTIIIFHNDDGWVSWFERDQTLLRPEKNNLPTTLNCFLRLIAAATRHKTC